MRLRVGCHIRRLGRPERDTTSGGNYESATVDPSALMLAMWSKERMSNSSEEDDIFGLRIGYGVERKLWAALVGIDLSGEYYPEESSYTSGIPDYRILGRFYAKIPVFKDSEILTLRLDSIESGNRAWGGIDLESSAVQNFSASITLMSAVIRFQIKNLSWF